MNEQTQWMFSYCPGCGERFEKQVVGEVGKHECAAEAQGLNTPPTSSQDSTNG
jgi:hypothetical protein